MADAAQHDLFLSYRRLDAAQVQPLVDALRARGLRVWLDVQEIESLESIQQAINGGLARSRALLVWYSARYNESRACQWELTTAYLAAQADAETAGDPRRRVLVVNPEATGGHIVLPELFDQQHLKAAELDADTLAERIVDHLADNVPSTPLGSLRTLSLPRMLPSALLGSNRFVGRLRWMWRLHATLQAGEAAMLTGIGGSGQSGLVQVRGAGGIGKSLLAEEYALRFGAAYPGGIFWLRAEGYTDRDEEISPTERLSRLEGQIIGLAQQLGLHITGLSPREVQGLFAGHLGRQGQPFLWIVDDLPADPGPDGLAPWLAPHPLGRTLITTRARRFNHVSLIELPQLDEAEALRLLSRGRPLSDADRPVAEAICRELGFHALAIDVAAALIELRGVASFLTRLQQASSDKDVLEVAARLDEALPNGHQRSIAATLLASIRELDASTLDVLRLAALLAPTPIPRDLIWRTIAHADDLFPEEAEDLCDPALSRAKSSSLADPADDGGIVVHTLVSRTLRLHELDASRTEPLRAAAVAVLLQEMPRVEDIREHGSLKAWVPHAKQLGAALNDAYTIALFGRVARYNYEQGQYAAALTENESQLNASRRVLGEEHPETLACMSNLALTLHAQGDLLGARQLQKSVLQVYRRVLGEEHSYTLTSMNNLAATLLAQGELTGAFQWLESALQIQRCVLGEEHPDTLRTMGNLAQTLQGQGDLDGARQWQESVLQVYRRVLGEEHSYTLTSMNNLATTLYARGDLRGARQWLESALQIQRRVLGEEHPDTLRTMGNLAQTLQGQGDLDGARQWQESALQVYRRVLGEEHPSTLLAMNNLATTLHARGDLRGARQWLEPALQIQRRVLGEEHPDTLRTMGNLAQTLQGQGDLDGARQWQESALQVYRRVLGEEHPSTLLALHNLGTTLRAQGDLRGARQWLEPALQIQGRVLGDRHNDTTRSAWNLFLVLQQLHEFDDANKLRTELLDWILTSPPEALSGQQKQIAQKLLQQMAPKATLAFKYQFKLSG